MACSINEVRMSVAVLAPRAKADAMRYTKDPSVYFVAIKFWKSQL
jgi:hypothetical protein